MAVIFFDLETSDQHCAGQILNYSFIEVDTEFSPIDECNGDIQISRTQLPRAGAILANKIDVLKHQKEARLSEVEAMKQIATFLQSKKKRDGKIKLIGYNSNRFDLKYLRTSLIRNGINPYFGGGVEYVDLLQLVQFLACSHTDFPRFEDCNPKRQRPGKLSLTLENITNRLGLLDGAQLHHSRDDVLLSISLAEKLKSAFSADICSFNAYKLPKSVKKGDLCGFFEPEYDLSKNSSYSLKPYLLLDRGPRYFLWVDLKHYAEEPERAAIRWHNSATHAFFYEENFSPDDEQTALARQALSQFEELSLSSFFEKSSCDIEEDIYRVDFDGIDALNRIIHAGDPGLINRIAERDPKILYMRFEIVNPELSGRSEERLSEMFKSYVEYRYGGKMQLSKQLSDRGVEFFPSYSELITEIKVESEAAEAQRDREILGNLERFYQESEVGALLG